MVQDSSAEFDSEENKEEVNAQTELILRTDMLNAFYFALRYVEQHASTPNAAL